MSFMNKLISVAIKKKDLLVNSPLPVLTVILFVFFFMQVKDNMSLRKELETKKKEFKNADNASRHLKELEKEVSDIAKKESQLYKRIPVNENEPLGLIKELISLAGGMGLKGITLALKNKDSGEGADQEGENALGDTPATESITLVQTGAKPIYLEMVCEGSFSQFPSFLDKLTKLERIVTVDKLTIERKKELLPYQEISLELITYTFPLDQ